MTNGVRDYIKPAAKKTTATQKTVKAENKKEKENMPKKETKAVSKTATKTVAPKMEKKETKKTAPKKTKTAVPKIEEKIAKTVALAINKKFNGLNLFFADKKAKTAEDSTFMKESMHMRWNNTDQCWYVRFKDRKQLDQVVEYFGDRLWLPEDLDSQVADVLGSMTNASKTKKTAPKVSFQTLTQAN